MDVWNELAGSISASLRPRVEQLLSKKCRSGGEPFATLRSIWPARGLNLRPSTPETNALLLDQKIKLWENRRFTLNNIIIIMIFTNRS